MRERQNVIDVQCAGVGGHPYASVRVRLCSVIWEVVDVALVVRECTEIQRLSQACARHVGIHFWTWHCTAVATLRFQRLLTWGLWAIPGPNGYCSSQDLSHQCEDKPNTASKYLCCFCEKGLQVRIVLYRVHPTISLWIWQINRLYEVVQVLCLICVDACQKRFLDLR